MSENSSKTAEKTATNIDGAGAITPHDGEVLRGFFNRIVHLRREQRELGAEISGIYKEAKGCGYSTGSMRDVLKMLEMDPAEVTMRLDLDQIYLRIARGGAVEAAEPVERNEEAYQAGRADALAGHRDHAAGWRDKFGGVDYELGHQEGERERADPMGLAEAEAKLADLQEQVASRAGAPAHEETDSAPFGMDRPKRVPRRRRAAEAFA